MTTLAAPTTFTPDALPELTRTLCQVLGHDYADEFDPDYDYASPVGLVPGTDVIWFVTRGTVGFTVEACTEVVTPRVGWHRWKFGVAAEDVLGVLRELLED